MSLPSSYYRIHSLIFCRNCAAKRPKLIKLSLWNRLEVGLTDRGIQVWCCRCKANVIHYEVAITDKNTVRNLDENPTPDGKKILAFGWRECRNCGPTDRWGKGLWQQEICLVCGREAEDGIS